MFLYKNVKSSSFKLYKSMYSIYIVKLVEVGNLLRSKTIVELYDLFGTKKEITKLDLIQNYVDTRFKRIKLYKYKHGTQYIVLKKEANIIYGSYVGNKVKVNSKFRELHGSNGIYVLCGVTKDNKIDRMSYCGLDKRLFRSFYKPYTQDRVAKLDKNITKVKSCDIDNKPLISNDMGISVDTQIEVMLKYRLVDINNNLVGFRLVDKNGNILDLNTKEVINLCVNQTNTKVINASVRDVNGKKYLYGLGMSLKELPSIRV